MESMSISRESAEKNEGNESFPLETAPAAEKPTTLSTEDPVADAKALEEVQQRLAKESYAKVLEQTAEYNKHLDEKADEEYAFQQGPVAEARKQFGNIGNAEWAQRLDSDKIKTKAKLIETIDKSLHWQKYKDDDRRELGTKVAAGVSAGGALAAFGGSVASVGIGTAAAFAGLGFAAIGVPLTAGVWGGMKLWHKYKEGRTRRKRDEFVAKLG